MQAMHTKFYAYKHCCKKFKIEPSNVVTFHHFIRLICERMLKNKFYLESSKSYDNFVSPLITELYNRL